MTEYENLLASAIEKTDDNGERLRLADWLDDHGMPFDAEYLRIGCPIIVGEYCWYGYASGGDGGSGG